MMDPDNEYLSELVSRLTCSLQELLRVAQETCPFVVNDDMCMLWLVDF
jgi:hypothetical protein